MIVRADKHNIVVDLNRCANHDNKWDTDPLAIYHAIVSIYAGQHIIFNSHDGDPLHLTGAMALIKKIASDLDLPKEKVQILCYDKFQCDFAVVIERTEYSFLFMVATSTMPIDFARADKKFLNLNGRYTVYRTMLAQHMLQNYSDDSLVSLANPAWALRELTRLSPYYDSTVAWLHTLNPGGVSPDWTESMTNETSDLGIRSINGIEATASLAAMAHRFVFEIATETDCTNPYWFTEKTYRPMAFGKPFLLFSGSQALKELKRKGFRTFGNFVDESYDQIKNDKYRFDALKQEIDRLASHSLDELKLMAIQMMPILEHNQQVIQDLAKKSQ